MVKKAANKCQADAVHRPTHKGAGGLSGAAKGTVSTASTASGNAGHAKGSSFFLFLLIVNACLLLPAVLLTADEIDLVFKKAKTYTSTDINAVKNQLINAEKDGIPLRLLIPRLQEGIAKQPSAGELKHALEADIKQFKQVRLLLLEIDATLIVDDRLWQHTFNRLVQGMSTEELTTILAACFTSGRIPAYPLATELFTSLIRWGIKRELALHLVVTTIQSALPAEQWRGIQGILNTGRSLHSNPEKLIARMIVLLPQIRTIQELKEKVLQ